VEPTINYSDFRKVDMRVGRIVSAEEFQEARKPAYKLEIDFGKDIGIKKSSAQLTKRYSIDNLTGRKIIAVVNFLPKQIANFSSEVLVLGVDDGTGGIILIEPEGDAELGARVY
jgi:tRNA-binding protein